jgi:hypothetical protein
VVSVYLDRRWAPRFDLPDVEQEALADAARSLTQYLARTLTRGYQFRN